MRATLLLLLLLLLLFALLLAGCAGAPAAVVEPASSPRGLDAAARFQAYRFEGLVTGTHSPGTEEGEPLTEATPPALEETFELASAAVVRIEIQRLYCLGPARVDVYGPEDELVLSSPLEIGFVSIVGSGESGETSAGAHRVVYRIAGACDLTVIIDAVPLAAGA